MKSLDRNTRGVIPIVPTPFNENGGVHYEDIPRLVEYYKACGACGLTILGVMGEAQKLSWEETLEAFCHFIRAADGQIPVIVGASGPSLEGSARLGEICVAEGGAGVMLQPLPGLKSDASVIDFFRRYADRTKGAVPICVQDYPQSSGVELTSQAWREISRIETVFMLKHEPPAGLQKLSAIRRDEHAGEAARVSILTSNNAMHLDCELGRGADGAMVGVAFTDIVCKIVSDFHAGRTAQAGDLYAAILPLVRHETQGAFGLAIRKEILRRRGALSSAALRYPAAILRPEDMAELDNLLSRLRTAIGELGCELSRPL
jgi:4-hydroxy-tetrahydrodipicolinate synthase